MGELKGGRIIHIRRRRRRWQQGRQRRRWFWRRNTRGWRRRRRDGKPARGGPWLRFVAGDGLVTGGGGLGGFLFEETIQCGLRGVPPLLLQEIIVKYQDLHYFPPLQPYGKLLFHSNYYNKIKRIKTKQSYQKQWKLGGKILTEPYLFIQNYTASSCCSKQSLQMFRSSC